MADNIQKVNLIDIDLNKSMIHRGWLNHSIGKADNQADAFGIRVYRDGEAVSLSGASVQGFFRNAEGTNIAITSGNSISGNTATVVLPQACYNVEGKFTLAIKLIASGITGTMRIVDGMVDNTNTGSAVAPTGTVPTYQEILAVYDQMVAAKEGSVRFDIDQELTDAQKERALKNIAGAKAEDVDDLNQALEPINHTLGIHTTENSGNKYPYKFTAGHRYTLHFISGNQINATTRASDQSTVVDTICINAVVGDYSFVASADAVILYIYANSVSELVIEENGLVLERLDETENQIVHLESALSQKRILTVPAGATENIDVFFDLPYDDFNVWFENDGAYEDEQDLTLFYTHSFDVGSVVMNERQVYRVRTATNRIRLHYSRMKKEDGVVVGGNIILHFSANTIWTNNNNKVLYVSDGSNVSWTETTPCVLTLSNDIILITGNGEVNIPKNDILAAAQAAGLTVDGNKISGTSFSIVYEITTGRIIVSKAKVSVGYLSGEYCVLFTAHYGSLRDGLLVHYQRTKFYDPVYDVYNQINTVVAALDDGYSYIDFTIPAGTTETLNFDFTLAQNQNFAGLMLYYEAEDTVYTDATENGICRVFNSDYTDIVVLYKNGTPKKLSRPPRWFRVYYGNMAKDANDQVIGGTIRLYYKPIVSLNSPLIDGKAFSEYFTDDARIPSYYESHIESKMKQVRDNMMEVGKDGETFVFITDTHWESNTKNSPALVKYLLSNLNINVMLNGGDLINQGEREAMAELMIKAITAYGYRNVPMLTAFGNHDSNWNNYDHQQEYPERYFDRADQYALMQKQHENFVAYFRDNNWSFYYDKPSTKTRFVVLDTGENGGYYEADFTALGNILNETPAGYHIIIMCHWLYNNGSKSTTCIWLEQLIDAYNAKGTVTLGSITIDCSSAKAEIMLLIAGHMHIDMDWATPNGVPVVLTDCDAGYRTGNTDYPFVAGTITEQAFDVVTINYQTKEVKAVRVGRGADRTFTRT